jgi:raffinose/stachyose/melibiose transport system permease protein
MNFHKEKLGYKKKENRIAFFSLLPIFLYHFILVVLPSFNSFINSFTNWNGLVSKKFIGFKNYLELLTDPTFYEAFANNLRWLALFLTIPIILSIFIGYFLAKTRKGQVTLRACYFLPYVISAAIAGKIFAAFYNPYFGINSLFEQLNLGFLAKDWLAPSHALFSVASVDMWHWWGFLLVVFLSAMQQIDPMLYESAEVEGANEMQKLWYITIPGIKKTLMFVILASMVWSISTFDYVWVMTKGSSGSSLLSTMLYKNAFFKYRAGYACAISVVQTCIAIFIFGAFALFQKKFGDE